MAAANGPPTNLPNIDEEVEEDGDEMEEPATIENDPAKLKKLRTTAKANHTRVMNKIWPAINNGSDRDTVRALQNNLVDAYDAAVELHDQYMRSRQLPLLDPEAVKWWNDLTDVHKSTLAAIDDVLKVTRAKSHVSGTSNRSSRHSSVSSAKAKLEETERLQQESLLKLQQEEEERLEREAEDENLFQATEYKKKVDAERRRRQLQHEIERQQLSSEILRKQLGESAYEKSPTNPSVVTNETSPDGNDMTAIFSPTTLTSRMNPYGYIGGGIASVGTPAATNVQRTQLFTPVESTKRTTSTVPMPTFLKTMRGLATRAWDVLTPSRQRVVQTPTTNLSSYNANIPTPPVSMTTPPASISTPSVSMQLPPVSMQLPPVSMQLPPVSMPIPPATISVSRAPGAYVNNGSWHGLVAPPVIAPPPHGPAGPPFFPPTSQPTTVPTTINGPARSFVPPVTNSWMQQPCGQVPTSSLNRSATPFGPQAGMQSASAGFLASGAGVHAPSPSGVYTPDSWIYQLGTPHYAATPSTLRPPRLELQRFNGDPRTWPMFIQSFRTQVHDACSSDAERLTHLRNCLSVDVQKQIGEALMNPGLYHFALLTLHRKYGNPQIVSQACTASLLKLQPFRDSDYNALRNFAANLHSVVATLQLGGYGMELHSNSTLSQLVSKLPPILRSRWGERSWAMQPNLPSVADLDAWLDNVSMAEFCIRPGTSSGQHQQPQPPKGNQPDKDRKASRPNVFNTTLPTACHVCKANHHLKDCKQFKAMPVEKRSAVVKENNICYRCLDRNHLSPECKKTEPCGNGDCGGLHHHLLHGAPRMYPRRQRSGDADATPKETPFNGATGAVSSVSITMLPILPVIVKANGRTVSAFALLDTGSEVTLVKDSIIDQLGINGQTETMEIETVSGRGRPVKSKKVEFEIESLDGLYTFQIVGARGVPSFNLTRRPVNLTKLCEMWPHLSDVRIPATTVEDVALLIGQDHPAALEIFESRSDPAHQRAPRALSTAFGWCVVGPLFGSDESGPNCNHLKTRDDGLANLVEDFIQNDTFGTKPDVTKPMGADERRAWKILRETTRHNGERYECGLLWKSDDVSMESNYPMALQRLLSLERRLLKIPQMADRYGTVIDEYVSLKHARKLSATEVDDCVPGRVRYNPHHNVVNPNKPDKCRVVFDLAAKCKGKSLNDYLLKGPDLLGNLIGILLRFREYDVPLVADVEKMFPQVRVISSDGPAFRFLWRKPGSTDPPDIYQMDVQVFGSICSPAVCSYAIRQAALESGDEELLKHIIRHFYMDNWLVSFRTAAEAISAAHRLTEALRKGGFPLTQWATANEKVRVALPGPPLPNVTLDMDLDKVLIERTLGLCWDFRSDVFVLKAVIQLDARTKRAILRAVASTFDPLGFLAPVIFTAKYLLQDIWRSGADWDEELSEPIIHRWVNWAKSLVPLNGMAIKRCVSPVRKDVSDIELHIFGDASEMGFGAVAYVRFVYSDGGADVSFLLCKSRIAPLKFTTIPRMKLCAAVLATRLCLMVTSELDFQFVRTFFWSDSTTVLSWIKSKSCRFNIYVGNRVGEILETSSSQQWNYVPTTANPADDTSRGVDAADLTVDHRWFVGPSFLSQDQAEWPILPSLPSIEDDDPEIRSTNWIGAVQRGVDYIEVFIQKRSRIHHIVRVIAWIQRLAENKRRKRMNDNASRVSGPLAATELRTALANLIRRMQEKIYQHEMEDLLAKRPIEKNSSLLHLSPFLDHRGLICVGGRIGKAAMPIDVRHPVILPPKERLTELIVYQMHIDCAHPSVDQMCCEVLRQYWIPQVKRTVQKIIHKCYVCRKYKAKGRPPKMASLPYYRLRSGYPAFTHTGVDYFGPIEVTIFRRKVKRWVCLFTCLSSRAGNLQMAYSMETDSFLIALNKFELARGTPATYKSDNGTNFVGAENELAECLKKLDQTIITDRLARKGVTWTFNPPAAPHFGGVWERMVRCAKKALYFVLPKRTLTDEMLTNAIAQVENLLNSRKLTKLSSDPTDPECLTPHHLLLGRANPNLPPDVFSKEDLSSKKRWRQVQAFTNDFWERWMFEIVASLTTRPKWCAEQRNLVVGDIVILIDDKNPRGTWPLGKVIEVYPGDDGVVRSARVQTRGTELLRPAHNLCLLESVDGPNDDEAVPKDVLGPAEPRAGNVRGRVSFGISAK